MPTELEHLWHFHSLHISSWCKHCIFYLCSIPLLDWITSADYKNDSKKTYSFILLIFIDSKKTDFYSFTFKAYNVAFVRRYLETLEELKVIFGACYSGVDLRKLRQSITHILHQNNFLSQTRYHGVKLYI